MSSKHIRTTAGMRGLYVLTIAQVETLASERTRNLLDTDRADSTYLRAIITATQGKLGPKAGRKPSAESQLGVLNSEAQPFYEAVLRGVTTDDIAVVADLDPSELTRRTRERNRRATFARSAKSTLAAWISAGGDIRVIDVAAVTKTELRTSVAAAANPASALERTLDRAQARILAAAARASPEVALHRLEAVIEALQAAVDELKDEADPESTTTLARTRAGAPSFQAPRVLHSRAA